MFQKRKYIKAVNYLDPLMAYSVIKSFLAVTIRTGIIFS